MRSLRWAVPGAQPCADWRTCSAADVQSPGLAVLMRSSGAMDYFYAPRLREQAVDTTTCSANDECSQRRRAEPALASIGQRSCYEGLVSVIIPAASPRPTFQPHRRRIDTTVVDMSLASVLADMLNQSDPNSIVTCVVGDPSNVAKRSHRKLVNPLLL